MPDERSDDAAEDGDQHARTQATLGKLRGDCHQDIPFREREDMTGVGYWKVARLFGSMPYDNQFQGQLFGFFALECIRLSAYDPPIELGIVSNQRSFFASLL